MGASAQMEITCPMHPIQSPPPVSPSGSPMTPSSQETAPPTPPWFPTSAPPPDIISSSPHHWPPPVLQSRLYRLSPNYTSPYLLSTLISFCPYVPFFMIRPLLYDLFLPFRTNWLQRQGANRYFWHFVTTLIIFKVPCCIRADKK